MRKYLETIIHILIWGVGYFILLHETSTIGDFKKDTGPYWAPLLFGMLMSQLLFYVAAFYIVPKYLRLKKTKTLIVLLATTLITIALFESFIDYNYLLNFFSSENEPFVVYFYYNLFVGFIILLVALSYALIKYWIQNEKLKRVLLEEKLSTEMAFLKSKINPHFLFNTLNTIASLIRLDDKRHAIKALSELSFMLRKVLENQRHQLISLEQEVEFIQSYLTIQKMRFSHKLKTSVNIDNECLPLEVPFMLLQPLVENAVQHGSQLESDENELKLSIYCRDNYLHVKLINNYLSMHYLLT